MAGEGQTCIAASVMAQRNPADYRLTKAREDGCGAALAWSTVRQSITGTLLRVRAGRC
jgi:hypothetical protein